MPSGPLPAPLSNKVLRPQCAAERLSRVDQMDVQAEQIIDEPYWLVRDALVADTFRWLPNLARDAEDRLSAELGLRVGSTRTVRSVNVEVQPPTIYPDRCELYITWKAATMSAFYPELTGTLQLRPAGPRQTRVSFQASYEPPGRALGRLADRALMHRVAEASIAEFLQTTARTLESGARSADQEPGG
jgi:hypothetical protein